MIKAMRELDDEEVRRAYPFTLTLFLWLLPLFDLDGRPDFFNPSASLDADAPPALTLDDDIDGDGTPDDADATPYCGSCG